MPPPRKSDWEPAIRLLIIWLLAPSRIDLEPNSPIQLCSVDSATYEWPFNLIVIATTDHITDDTEQKDCVNYLIYIQIQVRAKKASVSEPDEKEEEEKEAAWASNLRTTFCFSPIFIIIPTGNSIQLYDHTEYCEFSSGTKYQLAVGL